MSKLKYAVLILLISSAALLHADGIAKYLDSDGDCYFHVRRKASAQSLHPADQSRYRQVFRSILTDAGFDSLGGFGASSIRLDNGYCRNRIFFQEKPSAEKTRYLCWNLMNGTQADIREQASIFPEDSIAAGLWQIDFARILTFAKEQFAKYGRQEMLGAIRTMGNIMRKCGFEPAQVFDSYAGTIGYAAVTDAGAEHSWIPFSSALYIKCRDNRIFRMFADKLPSILTRAVEKQEGNAAYVIPLPFTRFAFCFAYSRNYVVFTSSVPMMEKVFTALTGGKSLASNDTFLKLAANLPGKGNSFFYSSGNIRTIFKNTSRYPEWFINVFLPCLAFAPEKEKLIQVTRTSDGILRQEILVVSDQWLVVSGQ